jgi:hypothetical protein
MQWATLYSGRMNDGSCVPFIFFIFTPIIMQHMLHLSHALYYLYCFHKTNTLYFYTKVMHTGVVLRLRILLQLRQQLQQQHDTTIITTTATTIGCTIEKRLTETNSSFFPSKRDCKNPCMYTINNIYINDKQRFYHISSR